MWNLRRTFLVCSKICTPPGANRWIAKLLGKVHFMSNLSYESFCSFFSIKCSIRFFQVVRPLLISFEPTIQSRGMSEKPNDSSRNQSKVYSSFGSGSGFFRADNNPFPAFAHSPYARIPEKRPVDLKSLNEKDLNMLGPTVQSRGMSEKPNESSRNQSKVDSSFGSRSGFFRADNNPFPAFAYSPYARIPEKRPVDLKSLNEKDLNMLGPTVQSRGMSEKPKESSRNQSKVDSSFGSRSGFFRADNNPFPAFAYSPYARIPEKRPVDLKSLNEKDLNMLGPTVQSRGMSEKPNESSRNQSKVDSSFGSRSGFFRADNNPFPAFAYSPYARIPEKRPVDLKSLNEKDLNMLGPTVQSRGMSEKPNDSSRNQSKVDSSFGSGSGFFRADNNPFPAFAHSPYARTPMKRPVDPKSLNEKDLTLLAPTAKSRRLSEKPNVSSCIYSRDVDSYSGSRSVYSRANIPISASAPLRSARVMEKHSRYRLGSTSFSHPEHSESRNNEVKSLVISIHGDPIKSYVLDGAKQNSVVIMARYVNNDPSRFIIKYSTVGEIDQSKMVIENFFILKILNVCDLKSNLFIRANGFRILSPYLTGSSFRQSYQTLVLKKNESTTISIEHADSELVALNGTIDFYEINEKETKIHGSIEVTNYRFPFPVTRNSSMVHSKNQSDVLSAAIRTIEELGGFFASENVNSLHFCTIKILMERILVKRETIDSFSPSKVQIENLIVTTNSKSSNVNALGLLLKLPLCSSVSINCVNSSSSLLRQEMEPLRYGTTDENVVDLLTNFFESPPNPSYLKVLKLVGVNLRPDSVKKVQYLGKTLLSFVRTTKETVLTLEDSKSSFHLLISLTSTEAGLSEKLEKIDVTSLLAASHFSLTFTDGKLSNLHVHKGFHVWFESYEDVTAICQLWRLPQIDNLKCEDFALIHQKRDYCFLFQLNNSFAFDLFQIFTKIQVFNFKRDSLIDTRELLSKIKFTEVSAHFSMPCVVIEIFEFDSRNEMDGLIVAFCKELDRLGIRLKTLKLEVHCDESGWALFRFTLTQTKTIVSLNDVEAIFPKQSTKEPQSVAIEINRFPKYLIDCINNEKTNGFCQPTPLVSIDHCEDKPFLQQISVVFPFPKERKRFYPRLFSKHPPEKMEWEAVSNYEIALEDGEKKLIYQSDTFSPIVGEFSTGEGSSSPVNYIQRYFKETTFVTILALEYRIGNVVFDCVKERDETDGKNLRLNPFFEKRKIPEMQIDQKLLANLGKNLTVLEPKLEKDNKLEFCSPDHEDHVSNQQEYIMRKVEANGSWRGYIDYSLVRNGQEKKLFHMFYQLPHVTPDIGQDDSDEPDHTQQPHGENHIYFV